MKEAGLIKAPAVRGDLEGRMIGRALENCNRNQAMRFESFSGLPYSDEQKKSRLRSHLSA
jgi:hypothetical protein